MPRKTRQESPTGIYHWMSRGYLKRDIFRSRPDFDKFLGLVQEYSPKHQIAVYHYCLMNNHLHFLVKAPTIKDLTLFSHFVKRRYAYYYSKTYRHAGATFEKRFNAIPVTDERYLLECGRYIERNPVRAGIVKHPADYAYSSSRYYLRGELSCILSPSPAYLAISEDPDTRRALYEQYVTETRPQEEYAENKALAF